MDINTQIYNIFNSDGRLLQVEYALENVNNSYQAISLVFDNGIVAISKKIPQTTLKEESHTSIFKIGERLYLNITGNLPDIDYVVGKCLDICSEKEYELDTILSPDIFARYLADKFQNLIQKSHKRIPAFAATILGFEKEIPKLHYTDLSAVEYPCFAAASGEDQNKITKYLEKYYKNTNEKSAVEIGIGALLQSIGKEAEASEIEVAVVKSTGITYYSNSQIEEVILNIQGNY